MKVVIRIILFCIVLTILGIYKFQTIQYHKKTKFLLMSELYNSHTDSLHFSKMYEQFYEKQPTRIYLSKTQLSSSDLLGSNQQEAFEVHQSFFEFLKLYLLVAEWEWTIVNKQNDFTVYYLKLRFVEKDAELCLTTKLFNDGRHYVTKIEQFSVVEDILKCIRKH